MMVVPPTLFPSKAPVSPRFRVGSPSIAFAWKTLSRPETLNATVSWVPWPSGVVAA